MALIATTYSTLKKEKEKRHQKLKKFAENRETIKYTVALPAHLFIKAKSKLAKDRGTMKAIFVKALEKYTEKE